MSPKKRNRAWVGWILSALLLAGSFALWQSRQWVVDAIAYSQYKPSAAIQKVVDETYLTEDAKFTFFASRPAIASGKEFNQNCQRKEADSPILGCYDASKIYIFDVTDERLKGIKAVTAAHELLHAEYERLSKEEKDRLKPLLDAAYKRVNDNDLQKRMDYYAKTEPGQSFNELHSILGTEYVNVGSELEEYFARYFTDRLKIVTLHTKVESVFDKLSKEADALVVRIEQLAGAINQATAEYNQKIQRLNSDVQAFNDRARKPGGFTTQSEFESELAQLTLKKNALEDSKRRIQLSIVEYKSLLARLDSINAESAELNKSLDSTLSEIPTI